MSIAIVTGNRYTVDSVFQWDKNQVLEIRGLSLAVTPEIHFSNNAMDGAIVRQATMDESRVITVGIPNTLLQKPYQITAHICVYQGDTFASLYKINIPVKARKKPKDYTFEDDNGEIYSFNALENMLTDGLKTAKDIYTNTAMSLKDAAHQAEIAVNHANKASQAVSEAQLIVKSLSTKRIIPPIELAVSFSAGATDTVDKAAGSFIIPPRNYAIIDISAAMTVGSINKLFIKDASDAVINTRDAVDNAVYLTTLIPNTSDEEKTFTVHINGSGITGNKLIVPLNFAGLAIAYSN